MSVLQPGLCQRYEKVKKALSQEEIKFGRKPNSVQLLPVSKTFGIEAIIEGIQCGMTSFGENYVQEACDKIDYCREHYPEQKLTWHLIGHLQSNKTRLAAEHFDWIQTIDSVKIAKRLSDQRPEGMLPINVLIEVNISDEATKSGVQPADIRALAEAVKTLPNLKLRGLMCIPETGDTHEEKMAPLNAMKVLFDELNAEGYGLDTLSMGMSGDMAEAVEAGSTMVRVGSAIFGPRDYSKKEK